MANSQGSLNGSQSNFPRVQQMNCNRKRMPKTIEICQVVEQKCHFWGGPAHTKSNMAAKWKIFFKKARLSDSVLSQLIWRSVWFDNIPKHKSIANNAATSDEAYIWCKRHLAAVVQNVDGIIDTVGTVITDPASVSWVHCWTVTYERHHRFVRHVRLKFTHYVHQTS